MTLADSVGGRFFAETRAKEYFSAENTALQESVREAITRKKAEGIWTNLIAAAELDLRGWESSSGRKQNYTPEELAEARVVKEAVKSYEERWRYDLGRKNAEHLAAVGYEIVASGLAERMMQEGREGRKLSVLEISSRLAPVLTFSGSSAYFEMAALPYGTTARAVLGESKLPHYVSPAAAQGSARNMQEKFGTHYVLAETSAAPRGDVPKSKRAPEVSVCTLVGSEIEQRNVQFPEVLLRAEFDACVREVLYQQLQKMYGMK